MSETESKQPFENDPILCPRDQKSEYEARNLRALYELTENFYPQEFITQGSLDAPIPRITRDVILDMHRICIHGIYPCAGSARGSHFDVHVQGSPDLPVAPSHLITLRLDELCEEIERIPRGDAVQGILFAPRLLHRITQIHPFAGGNGRVGRALVDLFLYRQRVVDPGVHIGYAVDEARDYYISGLREADAGNASVLGEFIMRNVLYLRVLNLARRTDQILERFDNLASTPLDTSRPSSFADLTDPERRLTMSAGEFMEHVDSIFAWQDELLQRMGTELRKLERASDDEP